MGIKEIDFKLIKDKAESKTFKLTEADETAYDMTGSTAICKFYKDSGNPISITCTIDVANGKITVPFTISHSDSNGTFEYIIEETTSGSLVIPVVKGNISVLDYIPFTETIEAFLRSELPATIVLTEDYRNQRIFYWRRLLQTAFSISDANINLEEKWPVLVNALLAKLVVYDAMMLASRGSFFAFMGGDYTSTEDLGGPVKKITTGPADVEFYSTAAALKNIFQPNMKGETAFDAFLVDLCGLANHLRVKIPMCRGNTIPIAPRVYKNPDWEFRTLNDIITDGGQVSQG